MAMLAVAIDCCRVEYSAVSGTISVSGHCDEHKYGRAIAHLFHGRCTRIVAGGDSK